MFKKKKNSYNIYQIHNEYEMLYKNIMQKENHLKSIQFEIEQKIEETKKIEHEKILNLKYAQFINKPNINTEKQEHNEILSKLKELETQLSKIENILNIVNQKSTKIYKYLSDIKMNISIMEVSTIEDFEKNMLKYIDYLDTIKKEETTLQNLLKKDKF